jgi:hypothetical protein
MADDRRRDRRFAMLLGLGLDGKDGHYRRTRGENFILVGGSQKTHEVMQEKALSLNEELRRRGKRLEDVDGPEEMRDIAHDAGL